MFKDYSYRRTFAAVFLSLACFGCWSAKEDAAKLEEIRSVWAQLPTYPGMEETNSNTTSGGGKAMISKKFRSDARYEDVRDFYVSRLEPEGWKIESEQELKDWGRDFGGHEIRLRKADLSFVIEHADRSADYGWEYGIAVSWSRWVRNK